MGKYSMKKGGKEVGPASVYAEPHTMSGKPMRISSTPGSVPNKQHLKHTEVSVGNERSNEYPGEKTTGIKMRGAGAATRGFMSRGPMA